VVTAGKRPAGKWTDAATGEHGDLLDVIRESCGLADFHDVTEEARTLPQSATIRTENRTIHRAGHRCRPARRISARRLFAMYEADRRHGLWRLNLRRRGITDLHGIDSLRYPSALLLSSLRGRCPDSKSGRQ